MTATALIIDDEADIRELIALTLTRMGLDFHTAANLDEARNLLTAYDFDICLTDMRLPDGNGVEFVRFIQSTQPNTPVAVITAHGNMEAAVEAMKNGAFDFVSKPVDITQLRQLVTHAVALSVKNATAANDGENVNAVLDDSLTELASSSLENLSGRQAFEQNNEHLHAQSNNVKENRTNLIGQSESIIALRDMIDKVSRTNAPIWITGESGTGKELIARLIHERGPRSENPFVAVNCGAIPSELMESELFGHKKGSFTGAHSDHDGLFIQAHGGTLFFDEVAELPLHMQVKLLRAIQERVVRPVGGKQEQKADVRILSASHIDLASEVEAGRFRHDLYYRLNVISMHAPSLRDRPDDIPLLVSFLLNKIQLNLGYNSIHIDADAISMLCDYSFPGNVRELENLLERATTMMDNNSITSKDIHLPPARSCRNEAFTDGIHSALNGQTSPPSNNSIDEADRARIAEALYRIQQLGIDKPG